MADQTPVTVHRNERRLAFIIAGLILIGLLGIIANIIFNAVRIDTADNPTLLAITLLPAIAFPAGILMIIVLMSRGHRTPQPGGPRRGGGRGIRGTQASRSARAHAAQEQQEEALTPLNPFPAEPGRPPSEDR